MEKISAKRLSKLLINSLENTQHLGIKTNRLSGKAFSYKEASTGKTSKGSIEKGRIQIWIDDEWHLVLEDGRHLLQAHVDMGLEISFDHIAFTSEGAKTLFTELLQ